MIPTLVLIYNPTINKTLSKFETTYTDKIRVVSLSPIQGLRLYSNPNTTPFVDGAILFDEHGTKVATRRDDYSDLDQIVETLLENTSPKARNLLDKFLNKAL